MARLQDDPRGPIAAALSLTMVVAYLALIVALIAYEGVCHLHTVRSAEAAVE